MPTQQMKPRPTCFANHLKQVAHINILLSSTAHTALAWLSKSSVAASCGAATCRSKVNVKTARFGCGENPFFTTRGATGTGVQCTFLPGILVL